MWLWVAGLAGVASATDSFLNRLALKEKTGDVSSYTLIYFVLISLLLFPFCLPLRFSSVKELWPLIFLQGTSWSIATIAGYMARARTHVSLQTILAQSRVLWVAILAPFFLAEKITLLTMTGIGVVFFGFVLLFYGGELRWHRGMTLTVLAAVFAAIGTMLNTFLVHASIGVFQVSFMMVFFQLPALALLFLFRGSNKDNGFSEVLTEGVLKETVGAGRRTTVNNILRTRWRLLLGATVLEAFAIVGINWAYQIGRSAPSTAVFMAVSAMTAVILGIAFLDERESIARKALSSAVIITGIVFIKLAS